MPQVIQKADKLSKCYFIKNQEKVEYQPFPRTDHFYLTQKDSTAIKEEIISLINKSEHVLKICSFILTDEEIYQVLLAKAKANKIAIFVLTQLDPSKLKHTANIDEIIEEEFAGSSAEQHMSYIKKLYDHGVHVRAAYTTHAKFIISDRQYAFITSANLTTPSLNINTESGVYLSPADAIALDKLFDIIFQKGTQYRHYISVSANKNLIVQAEVTISQKELSLLGQLAGLRFTYEDLQHSLYEEIIRLIQTAKKFVYLSSYCFVDLQNLPKFTAAITEAISRNVKVLIFCRGMNFRNDHLAACDWLANAGCKLYGDVYNHSKGIANEENGLIFTANVDGRHGLNKGFEVGCILNEDQRAKFVAFHEAVVASSHYQFQCSPSRNEFFLTYREYEDVKGIDAPNFPKQLIIESQTSSLLTDTSLKTAPIFYAEKGDEKFLLAGSSQFRVSYQNGRFNLLSRERQDFSLEKYILCYDTLTIN